jgi:alpha-tubulin suppressor-like RCC1 family protein
VAAGGAHSLGLKAIGTIIAWGYNEYGQTDMPDSAPFIAVAAGNNHSLGLQANGSIAAWGYNSAG